MNYEIIKNETEYLVTLDGDFDLFSSFALEKELNKKLEKSHANIRFDCSRVHYVDSAGIGCLMRFKTFANNNNITLMVSGISDEIHNMFKLVKLDLFLNESLIID